MRSVLSLCSSRAVLRCTNLQPLLMTSGRQNCLNLSNEIRDNPYSSVGISHRGRNTAAAPPWVPFTLPQFFEMNPFGVWLLVGMASEAALLGGRRRRAPPPGNLGTCCWGETGQQRVESCISSESPLEDVGLGW